MTLILNDTTIRSIILCLVAKKIKLPHNIRLNVQNIVYNKLQNWSIKMSAQ